MKRRFFLLPPILAAFLAAAYALVAQSAAQLPAASSPPNDAIALQLQINQQPAVGGSLTLNSGQIYHINRPLDFRGKSFFHWNLNGATLVQTNGGYPYNRLAFFGAMLRSQVNLPPYSINDPDHTLKPDFPFNGTVHAGDTTFPVVGPKVGDMVFLALGSCTNDATMPDAWIETKVTATSAGTITVDTPCPHDVIGTKHGIYEVVAPGDNCTVENGSLDWQDGVEIDTQISAVIARGLTVQNIAGRFSIGVGTMYVDGLSMRNFRGQTIQASPSGSRVFSGAQTQNFHLDGIHIRRSNGAPIIFLETNTRDGILDNIAIDTQLPAGTAWGAGWLFLDNADNIDVRGVELNCSKGSRALLVSDGTGDGHNHSGLSFEKLSCNVPLEGADYREIYSGTIDGVPLGDPQTIDCTVILTHGQYFALPKGVIRWLKVYPPPHVTKIWLRPNNAGPGVSVTPGQWCDVALGPADWRWNGPLLTTAAQASFSDDNQFTTSPMQIMASIFPAGQKLP